MNFNFTVQFHFHHLSGAVVTREKLHRIVRCFELQFEGPRAKHKVGFNLANAS